MAVLVLAARCAVLKTFTTTSKICLIINIILHIDTFVRAQLSDRDRTVSLPDWISRLARQRARPKHQASSFQSR